MPAKTHGRCAQTHCKGMAMHGHSMSQYTRLEEPKQKVTVCLVLITSLAVSLTQLCQEAGRAYGHLPQSCSNRPARTARPNESRKCRNQSESIDPGPDGIWMEPDEK